MVDINKQKASTQLNNYSYTVDTGDLLITVYWLRMMVRGGQWTIFRHQHSSYEFHFVVEGEGEVQYDHKSIQIKKGQFYVALPHEWHEQHGSPGKNYTEYCMNCDVQVKDEDSGEGRILVDALNQLSQQSFPLKPSIVEDFELALQEVTHKEIGFYQQIKTIIPRLIVGACRSARLFTTESYDLMTKRSLDDQRIMEITRYIKDNISTPLTAQQIANQFYLSTRQLNRVVQNAKQLSTKEYVNVMRMKKAKKLLSTTDMSINVIASELGFTSQYYFYQFFKKREGYSPSKYRHICN